MTPRERLLKTLNREMPDRAPCTPDISNMIPCRLTGKPFWDIYLYQDPPLWKAYIDAVTTLGIDGFLESVPFALPEEYERASEWTSVIVSRTDERIITRDFREGKNGMEWSEKVRVFDRDQPATSKSAELMGMAGPPLSWEPVEGVRQWPVGAELLELVKREMGDAGIVSVRCGTTLLVDSPEAILEYHDNPEKFQRLRDKRLEYFERLFNYIASLDVKPDFIAMGASGTLIWQSPATFRELGLPVLKRMSALCREAGIPSHVHSCGPESALVEMAAEETDLVSIDPLEQPPMGDCNLADIKRSFGHKLVLKGNLHTTEVMLRGTPDQVADASRNAIEAAGEGGGFILSTGDQCGRDTPLENIQAMLDACERYGRY